MSSQLARDRTLPDKLKAFAKYFKPPDDLQTNSLQTWVVVAHYKWTVGILSALFACILSSWYILAPMECIVKAPTSEAIPFYQEDICLSYPFTFSSPRGSGNLVRKKIYALHYRWIHWAILFLVPLYSIPILCRKYLEYSNVFSFMMELKEIPIKNNSRDPVISIIVEDFVLFSGWVYRNVLLLHFVNLLVDISAFAFIDFALQNRFGRLFPLDYPFKRWPQYFNDSLSIAFPPFVECNIGPEMMLMNDMSETLACSLNLMIFYEKVFIVLWVWMVLLTIWSLLTLIYFLLLSTSKGLRKSLINLDWCNREVNSCIKLLPVSSLLVFNCLRNILTTNEYGSTLKKISDKMIFLENEAKINYR